MVSKSFKQFQFIRQKEQNRKLYQKIRHFISQTETLFDQNPDKSDYFHKIFNLERKKSELEVNRQKFYANPRFTLNFLTIGRVVFIAGLGWCPIINFSRVGQELVLEVFTTMDNHNDPFLNKHLKSNAVEELKLFELEPADEPRIISVDYSRLVTISSVVLVIPNDMTKLNSRKILKETIYQMIEDFSNDLPILELKNDIPIENDVMANECETLVNELLEVNAEIESLEKNVKRLYRDYVLDHREEVDFNTKLDYFLIFDDAKARIFQKIFIKKEFSTLETDEFLKLVENISYLAKDMITKFTNNEEDIESLYKKEKRSHAIYFEIKENIVNLKTTISQEEKIVEHEKLESMKRVVRRKDFLNEQEVVIQKGRVASHIFGVDELLITEILLQGLLVEISARQLPVLFSVFVNESKPNEKTQNPKIEDEIIMKVFDQIRDLSKELATASKESGLDVNVEQAQLGLNPSLMRTVSLWVEGKSFADVCMQSDEYEGNIIRSIKRLYEMLNQLSVCADVLGNKQMKQKFSDGAELLNRGIVFAASLYV
jgi:superfamily II RNA helicase